MNLLVLTKAGGTKYEMVDGKPEEVADGAARKYLADGWIVELFVKHSDIVMGRPELKEVSKSIESSIE